MSDSDSSATTDATPTNAGGGSLANLRRMSSTAGVSSGAYRPVNPLAAVAGVLALLALGTFVHAGFLAAAAVGIASSAAALWQVRRSSGTQAGGLIASVAFVLCLGLVAWSIYGYATRSQTEASESKEVRAACDAFGQLLASGDYDAAYAMTHPAFQEDVPASRFRFIVGSYPQAQNRDGTFVYGAYLGASAGERIRLSVGPGNRPEASLELSSTFENAEPLRQPVVMRETDDGWKFRSFELWFP
ncbi:MAG: hypothetical protein AAGI46_16345 [Planctomycetota bacterium]